MRIILIFTGISINCIDLISGKLSQNIRRKGLGILKSLKQKWSILNELLNVKKSSHKIPDIFIDNGKIYSGLGEITDGLNDFFF